MNLSVGDTVKTSNGVIAVIRYRCAGVDGWGCTVLSDPNPPPFCHLPGSPIIVMDDEEVELVKEKQS